MLLLFITPDISGLKFVFTMVTILEKRNSVDHFWDLTKGSVNRKRLFISSLIRKKGESQNRCFKKTKYAKFSEKTNISYPLRWTRIRTYVCVSGGKKFCFFGKFGVLCFLETPVLRFALFLITEDEDITMKTTKFQHYCKWF